MASTQNQVEGPVLHRARFADPVEAALARQPVKRGYLHVASDFELARDTLRLQHATLLRETYVTAASVRGVPAPGRRSLVFVAGPAGEAARPSILGEELAASSALLTRDGEEWFGGPFAPGSQVATIVFDPAHVAQCLAVRLGGSFGLRLPESQCVLRGREPALAALVAKTWEIWRWLDAASRTPAELAEIEGMLLAAMGSAFVSIAPRANGGLHESRRERAVRLAIAFSETATADRLSVPQLCRVAGVSRRTLEYGFREAHQCSPARYLKERRLQGARDELAAFDPSRTVTKVALRWGFSDLSQFAQDYLKRFGERPSATLAASRSAATPELRRAG